MFVFVRGQDGSSGFRCLCWGEGERLLGGEGWGRCLCVGGGRGRVWARERRRGGGACVCLKRQGAQGQGLCAASVSPFSHHAQLPGSRGNAAVSAISALLLQVWCMGCVCMSRCCLPAQLSHRVCQQVCCQCWSDSVVVDLAVCLVDAWVGHVGGVLLAGGWMDTCIGGVGECGGEVVGGLRREGGWWRALARQGVI